MNLLILTALPTLALVEKIPNQNINTLMLDELDQESTQVNTATAIGSSDKELAQSFTPTLPTLTRVNLRLKLDGIADFYKYYVDIKESYLDSALTSAYIDRSELVIGSNFCEFDFPDVKVIPGNKYFIIVRGVSDSGDSGKVYWWYGYPDPYAGGDAWYESISGWNYLQEGVVSCDFYFQTFGMHNQPPNNPVASYDRFGDELVITATDPDNDQIRYGISWDNDNIVDQWTNLVSSGTQQNIGCNGRTGTVKVIAEDEYGEQSNWVSVISKNNDNTIALGSRLLGIGFVRINGFTHVIRGFVIFGINDGQFLSMEFIRIKFSEVNVIFAGYFSSLIFFIMYNPA